MRRTKPEVAGFKVRKDFIMTYKNRYTNSEQKQAAYMNACDCLYYGYGRDSWNACGLSDEEADAVWKQAFDDMAHRF